MHWVRWDRVLADMQEGGLGVGSLLSFNRAMLFKWWWRFSHNPTLLWVKVVKAIYGADGGSSRLNPTQISKGPWSGILCLLRRLRTLQLDFLSLCPRRLGKGDTIDFWQDRWLGGHLLVEEFPRVYMLDA